MMKLRAVGLLALTGLGVASLGVAAYKNMSVDRGVTFPAPPDQDFAHNFDTPEGAVLCLKDALRARDIESAVRCRDFVAEAKLHLRSLQLPTEVSEQVLANVARAKEQAFRQHYEINGFPPLSGADLGRFIERREVEPGLVLLMESVQLQNGEHETASLYVTKTDRGWRVAGHVAR